MSNINRKYLVYFQNQKKFVEVDKEFYLKFYRDVWSLRKRLQRSGECVCPKSDNKYCDGDCFECKHHRIITYSLDQTLEDEPDCYLENVISDSSSPEQMYENAEIYKKITEFITTLSENDKKLCFAIMNKFNNREIMELLHYKGKDGSFFGYKERHIKNLQKKFKNFY